jgi:hypothetical protein
MKVKLDHILADLEGNPLIENVKTKEKDEEGKPVVKQIEVTLGKICANALMMQPKTPDTPEQKCEKGRLAMRIWGLKETELSIEELALLKEHIGIAYGPLVVVQAWDLLEGKTNG